MRANTRCAARLRRRFGHTARGPRRALLAATSAALAVLGCGGASAYVISGQGADVATTTQLTPPSVEVVQRGSDAVIAVLPAPERPAPELYAFAVLDADGRLREVCTPSSLPTCVDRDVPAGAELLPRDRAGGRALDSRRHRHPAHRHRRTDARTLDPDARQPPSVAPSASPSATSADPVTTVCPTEDTSQTPDDTATGSPNLTTAASPADPAAGAATTATPAPTPTIDAAPSTP
jgi:hypothetical protein